MLQYIFSKFKKTTKQIKNQNKAKNKTKTTENPQAEPLDTFIQTSWHGFPECKSQNVVNKRMA